VRAAALGVIVLTATVVAATTTPTSARNTIAASCGHELRDLKTLSDPRRNLIYLRPRSTTIIAINKRPMPHPTPKRRSRGFERHVWRVVAQITDYRLGLDGDIHMILFDKSDYMIAAMPAVNCVPRTARHRASIVNARRLFRARCGRAVRRWRKLGAVVHIDGVGLWNVPHGQRGHARNYAELRPVTRIRFIAGCTA
jgi:hypothetical protein